MDQKDCIVIKGARVNNLKNIDVAIPRNKLIVVTGLSGSGKSSLAFDTLYAEGQRRYVESLSSYARQFLGRMSKPECDYIKGIPPAIAIEQRVNTRNPRSTVGTSTEIYDYIRLLYARVGKTISPVSGEEVKKHHVNDIVDWVLSFPEGTRFGIFAPIVLPEGRKLKEHLIILQKEGYTRFAVNGEVHRTREMLDNERLAEAGPVEILIDRLAVSGDNAFRSRLGYSAETAFFEGRGACVIRLYLPDETITKEFTKKFEADNLSFEEPSDAMFSFNNPLGACPNCGGLGNIIGIDENLVIPDKRLSVYAGAVFCWRGEVMSEWQASFIRTSNKYKFPIHRPYQDLSAAEKAMLWEGTHDMNGINDFFKFVEDNTHKIQYRVLLERYRGKTVCPACKGARLKPQALYVQVGGKDISQLVALPITELEEFFARLTLNETDAAIAKRVLTEIRNRIRFLLNVGLGYLTLDRVSASLSGGESQRINLATSLGSNLVGSLYILDEPSIGLHSRDTALLIGVLKQLGQQGNTVVVVEHDEEIIRAADYIIDIGPKAGRLGGEVIYQGDVARLQEKTESHTVRYLTGEDCIAVPSRRRRWNNYILVEGASKNNLKGIDVKFPLHAMTVVTGVSGSGKSTLVRDILYENLKKRLDGSTVPVNCTALSGDCKLVDNIDFVDQHSIGKSSRSNPVTYIGAYEDIRKLYSEQPMSRWMDFPPSFFSFNTEGGRCEECKGEGSITVEMQFMADIALECEACHGKRFKPEILEVEYKSVNIYGILDMTVDQAIDFFSHSNGYEEKKILRRLRPLQDVGLGYIKLGQPSSTLSGGENQRVKLASYLSQDKTGHTFFIFDEPTTGLHFHDIKTLLKALNELVAKGHTVLIIEHNPDVIKCADHLIDLGPGGGNKGGSLVCTGTPEAVAQCPSSYTGRFLVEKLPPLAADTSCQ